MIVEQIQAARALRWRQKANPILTLEDATEWMQQTGICLFLPRKAQLPAPAPSFVEACLGETTPTPAPAAIHEAAQLLNRLVDSGAAIPLNLLGTHAEQPDFLVSPDTFAFVFSLRGDKEWKRAPRTAGAGRVSPLVLEVWKTLERKGALSAAEIQETLGKELTEAAVLRALFELWGYLRVIPSYEPGEPTVWEPVEARFRQAIHSGGGMSQVSALSVLVSLYLQSAVAATSEDVETFLSPLTSRTKVREVIRGLTATRQLMLMPMDGQTLMYVEGSLPEFEEIAVPEPPVVEAPVRPGRTAFDRRPPRPGSPSAPRERHVQSGTSARPATNRPPTFGERARTPRPAATQLWKPAPPAEGLPTGDAPAAAFSPRPAAPRGARPTRPDWKTSKTGAPGKPAWKPRPSSSDGKPSWKRDQKPPGRPASATGDTDRPREFRPRPAAGGKPFAKPYAKPFSDRGERASGRPAQGGAGKPAWKDRAKSSFSKSSFKDRAAKPAWKRDDSRSAPGSGSPRKPGKFQPRPPTGSASAPKPFSDRRERSGPRPPAPGGARPAWKDRPRPASGKPAFRDRSRPASGKPPVKDRSAKPRWDRPRPPAAGEKSGSATGPREYRPRPSGGRPAGPGSSRPRPAGSRPSSGGFSRSGPGASRPFSSKPRSSGGSSRPPSGRGGSGSGRPPYSGKGKPGPRGKSGTGPRKRPE